MTNHFHIRLAHTDDADALARVHVDTWRTSYVGIVPDEHLAQLSYAKRAERWRENFATFTPAQFVLVAENELQRVIAFALGGPERENDPIYKGELYGLYVLKEYQRQGLGRRLVETVTARLWRDGFRTMLIWVLAENPARDFYAALGGKPVREKMVTIGGKPLREIGFGWDELEPLLKSRDMTGF